LWLLDSVGGILFVVVYGVVVAVAIGGWWYCGFVCGVCVGVGGCVVLILKLVVFWCCNIWLVVFYFC
jgi:hypothetical protein